MQQKGLAEINTFVAGFVSDASPLTFPPNTSKLDVNMRLNTNGSRQRALGIDYEQDYEEVDSGITYSGGVDIAIKTYRWENVGGNPNLDILCVQISNVVSFFLLGQSTISRELIESKTFTTASTLQKFSFSTVDGNLIIVDGTNLITIVQYDGTAMSYSTSTIKVRDFFGVGDFNGSTDLTNGLGLTVRPSTLTEAHKYNLRNQSFGIPRVNANTESVADPISSFFASSGVYPSNSDTVPPYLYPDANDADDRLTARYFPVDSIRNPLGTAKAAQGYFIIDLLNRGESRLAEYSNNRANYTVLGSALTTLPTDQTPGGATVVGEFAGRVWYGGFSGEVIDGDDKSPKLSSYVAFSRLVTTPSEVALCYQEGDPTSGDAPDIVDTDGGFIRISNAYGIQSIINLGSDLMIGAANGWWRIFGGNDSGFSATNYIVSKITDRGVRGSDTVVEAENMLFYWSDDGIYSISRNQLGDWEAQSMTRSKIQTFYDSITPDDKEACVGEYDSYQKTVRWLYQNGVESVKQQKELVFSLELGAFYERHISQISESDVPLAASIFKSDVFRLSVSTSVVTVSGETVTVGGAEVTDTVSVNTTDVSSYETSYLTITSLSPTITYTFAAYTDQTFTDWVSYNDVGVDAESVLITGASSGGDSIRQKQVPYIAVHMRRTENGFEVDGFGDWIPTTQSSCLMRGHWDWTNSPNSNKWTPPFQVYRYKRVYLPDDVDSYDTGHETIVTKNKLRGRGRAIALEFRSEPKKEMHIYGWSMMVGANPSV
jgi:hypothetical protein